MSTARALHSIRRLLAFACLLLSLVVMGVGELAYVTGYDGTWSMLVLVGLIAACLSAAWFIYLLAAGPPSSDERAAATGPDDESGDDESGDEPDDARPRSTSERGSH